MISGIIIKGSVDGLSSLTMESIIKKYYSHDLSSEMDGKDSTLRSRRQSALDQSNINSLNHDSERYRNYWNERCESSTKVNCNSAFISHGSSRVNCISNVDWRLVNPIRLCPTCLVDKSRASTHCSVCDVCVVDLDHHCAFVNNCVSGSNRRNFFLFTGGAMLGCLYFTILAFFLENNYYNDGLEVTNCLHFQ